MAHPTLATSLYIHIPFCRHRCGYCAFAVSTKGHHDRDHHQRYIRALNLELYRRKSKCNTLLQFRTLYIGGGTPSRLHPEDCQALFSMLRHHFPKWDWEEITFEINPEDLLIHPQYPKILQEIGVTRISLGTQTTSPLGLKVLERQTNPGQVIESVQAIRQCFSGSLSLDLIMGWPGQTVDMLENDDLPFLQQTQPDHLSIYLLNVEPGTKLERDRRKGKIQLLDDDTSASIWESLHRAMEIGGYEHYEISNFSKPGHASLHNTLTWRQLPYLGIGTGAVSRMGKTRWTNVVTPELYIQKVEQERWPVAHAEAITARIAWQENLLLSLRHREGLDMDQFALHFQPDLPKAFYDSIQIAEQMGEVQWQGHLLSFHPKGWSRFDAWISDWMALLDDMPLK